MLLSCENEPSSEYEYRSRQIARHKILKRTQAQEIFEDDLNDVSSFLELYDEMASEVIYDICTRLSVEYTQSTTSIASTQFTSNSSE